MFCRFLDEGCQAITGTDASGQPLPGGSPCHEQLVAQGRKWALHVTETPLAWGLSLLQILLTVWGKGEGSGWKIGGVGEGGNSPGAWWGG